MAWSLWATACGSGSIDEPTPDAPGDLPPSAAELLERLASCDAIVGGPYASDDSLPADVSICGLPSAVFWTSDLDIDCDGKMTEQCNPSTDPAYQDQTAAVDSSGDPLDAAALPFVVIPGRSERFDFRDAGLAMGSVVAVIFEDQVEYGVLGDVGPREIIGEASYRMAELLGIDPDPSTGGTEAGVSYIAFTGDDAVVDVIEDHAMAVALGTQQARALLGR